jgi:hypothetical protein
MLHKVRSSAKHFPKLFLCECTSAKGPRAYGRSHPKARIQMQNNVLLACQVYTLFQLFIHLCSNPVIHHGKYSPQSNLHNRRLCRHQYEERGAEPDSGLDTCPRKPRPEPRSAAFVACVRQQLLTSYVFVFFVMRHIQSPSSHRQVSFDHA